MAFQCLRCGACCRHPGEVRLEEGEPERIAQALGVQVDAFIQTYTRLGGNRRGLSLIERADQSCVFLEEAPAACRIEAAKPRQCREFPMGWRYAEFHQVCPAAETLGEP